MKPNVRVISNLTGFSPATVSNALNNKKGVSRETAEQIIEAAKKVGYFSEVKIDKIKVIVYMINGAIIAESPFFLSLFTGIEAECRNHGYTMVMHQLVKDEPDYDRNLEGLLFDPSSALLILATVLEEKEAAKFQNALGPVVILDNWFEDLDFSAVLSDNTDAVYRAMGYLIDLGHQKIGYLHSNFEMKNFYYRRQGYLRAIFDNALEYDPKFTFMLTPNLKDAYEEMSAILTQKPVLPTAFFADNDSIALGAMRALRDCGYRIPEDISIVGFDDLPLCQISDPPLTTVKINTNQMGCAAVRRLVEMINGNVDYQTKTQIKSSFIERSSVKKLNG